MTSSSTTDLTGHPDVAEIADLSEGLLPAPRATVIRRHVESCALCADVYTSLEEIQGLLGSLPAPPPMPDDVASRIDAALTAKAPPSAIAPQAQTVDTDADARVSRETSAPTDRPAGHARPFSTGPGRKERRRGGRRRIAVLGAVAAAAAIGLGSVVVSSLTGGNGTDDTAAQERQTALADTFSEARLQDKVAGLVADEPGTPSGPRTPRTFGMESENGSGPDTGNHVFKQPTVPECVQQGIGRDDAAIATEDGVYRGKEALLVVLSDPANDSRVTAYIVESTCVHQPTVGKAKILLKHSYTRP